MGMVLMTSSLGLDLEQGRILSDLMADWRCKTKPL